jgi:predicted DNA-binding transcriptional regulator YafY
MPWAWDELVPVDERTCEYRTGDDDLHWLAMRVGMFGGEIEVHEPPELREHLAAWAAGVGRAVA